MAPMDFIQQRVRARKDDSDEEIDSDTQSSANQSSTTSQENTQSDASDEDADEDDDTDEAPSSPSFKDISFGALAAAQETLSTRKRSSPLHHPSKTPSRHTDPPPPPPPPPPQPRTSKHAPTALSSKHRVPRKREILPPNRPPPRDPRFSSLSGILDPSRLSTHYSFLNDYRASEMHALKESIRNTNVDEDKEKLKRALRSMESRRKAQEAKEAEREVVRAHRREEAEAVGKGKRVWFLKKGEMKRRVLERRFEGLGEKRAEKVVERRRKKMASRERKGMPAERRGVGGQ